MAQPCVRWPEDEGADEAEGAQEGRERGPGEEVRAERVEEPVEELAHDQREDSRATPRPPITRKGVTGSPQGSAVVRGSDGGVGARSWAAGESVKVLRPGRPLSPGVPRVRARWCPVGRTTRRRPSRPGDPLVATQRHRPRPPAAAARAGTVPTAAGSVEERAARPPQPCSPGSRPGPAVAPLRPADRRPAQGQARPPAGFRWVPSWKLVRASFLFGLLAASACSCGGTRITEIPVADEFAEAQTTVVYYADGKTEMGRFAAQNRTSVPLASCPRTSGRGDRGRGPHASTRTAASRRSRSPAPLWGNVRGEATPGRLDDHPAVRQELLPRRSTGPLAQGQGGVHRAQDRPGAEQGRDPRGLPQHHLLRPGRLRHPGRGQGVLRQGRRRS